MFLLNGTRILCALLLCLLLHAAAAAPLAEDLTFYSRFDGTLDADYSVSGAKPVTAKDVGTFEDGVLGKAVVVGGPGTLLSYGATGVFTGKQGAISIWIKPTDYAYRGDVYDYFMLNVPGRLLMKKSANSGGVHLEWPNIGSSSYVYPRLLQNEWSHLVYTWGNGWVALYSDGKFINRFARTNKVQFGLPGTEFPDLSDVTGEFTLCDPSASPEGRNRTVLDETMIFKRTLTHTEVKSLYRRVAAQVPEQRANVARLKKSPRIDGTSAAKEWDSTASFSDFADIPFGNLLTRPVRANLGYDSKSLYVRIADTVSAPEAVSEVCIAPARDKKPLVFRITDSGQKSSSAAKESLWTAAVVAKKGLVTCEVAIPWSTLGVAGSDGKDVYLNILRQRSTRLGDTSCWAQAASCRDPRDGTNFAAVKLSASGPVFAMEKIGKPHYAILDYQGKVTSGACKADIRLQPSDVKEYWDPKTLPGTKSYTGTRILLGGDVKQGALVQAARAFSDTDINSIYTEVTDPKGGVIYRVQRNFVARPPIVTTLRTYPDHNRLEIDADISNFTETSPENLRAEFAVKDRSGKVVAKSAISAFSKDKETVELPLSGIPGGQTDVVAALYRGDQKVSEFVSSFNRLVGEPWKNCKFGLDETVIPPFTPVQVKGQSVFVWNREYRWNDSLLPIQVISDGKELLAGPAELLAGQEPTGKPNPATVRVTEATDGHAVVITDGKVGGVPVHMTHRIEYDGMCLTRMELLPEGSANLPGLVLYMPYAREESILYMMSPGQCPSGAVRETKSYSWPPMNGGRDFDFVNTLWLGNDDRGMTWFTESQKGWKLGPNPMGIAAKDDRTEMRVRFASQPFTLDKPREIVFGLIATPVRQLPDNWRTFRRARDWNYRWFGPFTSSNNNIANAFPSYKEWLKNEHKNVPLVAIYQMPVFMNLNQPECAFYEEEWVQPPRRIAGSDEGPDQHVQTCLGAGGWRDFMVYWCVKNYDDLEMDGYYFDGAIPFPGGCANTLHGCGWYDDDGNLHPSYPILGTRDFYKRLAIEFARRERPYIIFVHDSGVVEMPTLSFATLGWNGEQFSMTAVPAADYNKIVTLPYFRVQFVGKAFGLPQEFLVEFVSDVPEHADWTALGLSMVHGVADSAAAGNWGSWDDYYKALDLLNVFDSFGIREKDAEFLPYWNNSNYVSVQPMDDDLVCSIWKRNGKSMVIVYNATLKAFDSVTVKLNTQSLGLSGNLNAHNLYTKENLAVSSGSITFPMGVSDVRVIVVENSD